MAFNNIAVCILINSTILVYFIFGYKTNIFLRKKSKESMDTFTQEKKSANRDSPLNPVAQE